MITRVITLPTRVYILGEVSLTHAKQLLATAKSCGVEWYNTDSLARPKCEDYWTHVRKCIDVSNLLLLHLNCGDWLGHGTVPYQCAVMYALGKGKSVVLALHPDVSEVDRRSWKWMYPALEGKVHQYVQADAVPRLLYVSLREMGFGAGGNG